MRSLALACLMLVSAGAAMAQDVGAGRQIAQSWCKGCHNVEQGARTIRDTGPPPFAMIAASKGMTATALTAFLFTSHKRMPDYSLSRKQVADVSAYILSLKGPDGH